MENEKTQAPLVSVVMCTYNDERTIGETIASVLGQTYRNFEFIIWNDGSTDGTETVVQSFHDDRIRYFCHKIAEGKKAQITQDFMIIARCESLIAGHSVDDALIRSFAYVEAGADGIMIHSKHKTGDDIKEFCRRFREKDATTPIVVVPTTYNHITEDELASWGINVVIYANHMLRAAYPAMVNCAKSILANGRSYEANDICMPIKDILELIPGTK